MPDFKVALIKPLFASVICAAAAWAAYSLSVRFMPIVAATIVAVIAACLFYGAFLLLLRAITKEDILMLPKGNKIVTVLEKYHLLR